MAQKIINLRQTGSRPVTGGSSASAPRDYPCNPAEIRVSDFAQSRDSHDESSKPSHSSCRKPKCGSCNGCSSKCGSCVDKCGCQTVSVPCYPEHPESCRDMTKLCANSRATCPKLNRHHPDPPCNKCSHHSSRTSMVSERPAETARVSLASERPASHSSCRKPKCGSCNGCSSKCGSCADKCGCQTVSVPCYPEYPESNRDMTKLCANSRATCPKLHRRHPDPPCDKHASSSDASSRSGYYPVPEAPLLPTVKGLSPAPKLVSKPAAKVAKTTALAGSTVAPVLPTSTAEKIYMFSVGPKNAHQHASEIKGDVALYAQRLGSTSPPSAGGTITLVRGERYTLRVLDLAGHSLILTTHPVGGASATPVVTVPAPTLAAAGQDMEITVGPGFPNHFYYQSSVTPWLGGLINVAERPVRQ